MILRLFEQDVQISGTKTGVTLGTSFLDKQQKVLYMDVLMLRSHGCE